MPVTPPTTWGKIPGIVTAAASGAPIAGTDGPRSARCIDDADRPLRSDHVHAQDRRERPLPAVAEPRLHVGGGHRGQGRLRSRRSRSVWITAGGTDDETSL